jgi:hypothetical protein
MPTRRETTPTNLTNTELVKRNNSHSYMQLLDRYESDSDLHALQDDIFITVFLFGNMFHLLLTL